MDGWSHNIVRLLPVLPADPYGVMRSDDTRPASTEVRKPLNGPNFTSWQVGSPWPRVHALFDCSSNATFARSTAGGITSPMPAQTRSVAALS